MITFFVLDYYNYYYGGYSHPVEGTDSQENMNWTAEAAAAKTAESSEAAAESAAAAAAVDAAVYSTTAEVLPANEAATAAVTDPPVNSDVVSTEVCFIKTLLILINKRCFLL